MMGKKDGQLCFAVVDLEELIPENHLLKKINRAIDFNFIYDITRPYYSDKGRPSIDPVCMIKMLLIGYLYGIRSERRLEEETTLNIAYRWFCGFNIMDSIPDHSVFSQNRRPISHFFITGALFYSFICESVQLSSSYRPKILT